MLPRPGCKRWLVKSAYSFSPVILVITHTHKGRNPVKKMNAQAPRTPR